MAAGNSEEPCDSLYKEAIECAGLEVLKQKQCEAIQSYIAGNDMFVVLPTGYGKSVIYAALPVIFDKLRGTNSLLQVLMDIYICYYLCRQKQRMYYPDSKPFNSFNDGPEKQFVTERSFCRVLWRRT